MATLQQAHSPVTSPNRGAVKTQDTLAARAQVYSALAEAMAAPVPGLQDLVLDAAIAGSRCLDSVACQHAVSALNEIPASDTLAMGYRYARLLSNQGGRPLALYESLHRQGRLLGQATEKAERSYRALGLEPIAGELPDHASVELAFLAHLVDAMAEAQAVGHIALLTRARAVHRRFLQEHAAAWLPEIGVAFARSADPFYAIVGNLLSGFLAEELADREQTVRVAGRQPALRDSSTCTLCGLCAGICPTAALRMADSDVETALLLNPTRCTACNRCTRTCPENALVLSEAAWVRGQSCAARDNAFQVLRESRRCRCPNCGQPTVSQAELNAVFARLQLDVAMQSRLCLCPDCKAWGD